VIDLHCHVLPGIDDGPAEVDDSLGMMSQAERDGIEIVCATPHIRADHDVRVDELRSRVDDLNRRLEASGVDTRVVPGGEVAETMVAELTSAELEAVSIGGAGGWILLEPAPGPLASSLERAVEHLDRLGFASLIAHPERHPGPDLHARLGRLIERGALVQLTAAMLEGEGAAFAIALAERGLVHVLGSDAHSSRAGRPVRLSGALRALGDVPVLAPHRAWIATTAPNAILRGERIDSPFPSSP
jgi:protein-tyrosine phosphatase